MEFSKWEQKQIAINKELVARAKTEFLDSVIACMLSSANEPDKSKDYVAWEKWKKRFEACKNLMNKMTQKLNKAVIKERAFLDVCMEYKHLEEMPNKGVR